MIEFISAVSLRATFTHACHCQQNWGSKAISLPETPEIASSVPVPRNDTMAYIKVSVRKEREWIRPFSSCSEFHCDLWALNHQCCLSFYQILELLVNLNSFRFFPTWSDSAFYAWNQADNNVFSFRPEPCIATLRNLATYRHNITKLVLNSGESTKWFCDIYNNAHI